MKIATVSENGTTISQHFGRAPLYIVLTVDKDKIVTKEKRVRGQQNICACHHEESAADCHESHGQDVVSQTKHADMADSIADCQVLIAGGMGWGAQESLKSRGIETVITDIADIENAVKLYLQGKLPNLMEKLH